MPRWRNLEAVLYDLDETLVYERAAARVALAEALRAAAGPEVDAAAVYSALRALFTTPEQPSFPDWVWFSARPEHWAAALERCGVPDPAAGRVAADLFQAAFLERVMLDEQARAALERTGSRYALGLLANGPALLRRAEIERLGIEDYFEVIVLSSEVRFTKPEPQFFMQALVDIGCRAGDAVMVGDDPFEDVLGAKATGLKSVWLNRAGDVLPADTPPPDIEIQSLAELADQLGM
jgi:putative hydrolase of the HAD superfamily